MAMIKASTSCLSFASPNNYYSSSSRHRVFLPPVYTSCYLNGGCSFKSLPIRRLGSNRRRCRAIRIQMNLFERLSRVVKSYANAAISSLEDPEKILDQAVLEMNDDLVKMRQATAQVIASQRRLENKYKAAEQSSADWYKRAQLALQKGDEELAREALKRRKSYADSASSLKTQLDQQKSVVENLISNSKILESKIQEAKAKKDTLKARAQTAKTATKVNEMLGTVNTSSALSAFEKMEEKVLNMESQAEALNELNADELDGKFAMLETSSVDDDLTKLKMELSGVSLIFGAVLALLALITCLVLVSLFSTVLATKFFVIQTVMVILAAAVVAALAGAVAAVAATAVMAATAVAGAAIAVAATATWVGIVTVAAVAGLAAAIAVLQVMLGRRRHTDQWQRFLRKIRWW